jgi:hypothetical protein
MIPQPELELVESPVETLVSPISRDWLRELRTFVTGLVVTAAVVFLAGSVVAVLLLAVWMLAPAIAGLAIFGLIRLDRAHERARAALGV